MLQEKQQFGNGFYFAIGNKEYFCVTNYQIVTDNFLSKIIQFLNCEDTEGNKQYLRYIITRGNCNLETHITNFGKCEWFTVEGKNYHYGIEVDKLIVFEV